MSRIRTQPHWVKLQFNAEQALAAGIIGLKRHIYSRTDGRGDRNGTVENSLEGDVSSAIAEAIFSAISGLPWAATVDNFEDPDVGGWEVRSTHLEGGSLIYRPEKDKPERPFVLMIGNEGCYCAVGWLMGWECMRLGRLIDPGKHGSARAPAYFTEQAKLHHWPQDGSVPALIQEEQAA